MLLIAFYEGRLAQMKPLTWCFHRRHVDQPFTPGCANATLNALLKIHLRYNVSPIFLIVHYDGVFSVVQSAPNRTLWHYPLCSAQVIS